MSTIPTMFALSFFGIIHVPINVPALGAAVREDNLDVNRELIAHGISNTLSGCLGSIQVWITTRVIRGIANIYRTISSMQTVSCSSTTVVTAVQLVSCSHLPRLLSG